MSILKYFKFPDSDDFGLGFNFVHDSTSEFNVLANVTFEIPCEISNELRGIKYEIMGQLVEQRTVGSTDCYSINKSGIYTEFDRNIYSIILKKLLPFFEYTVSIELVLQNGSKRASLKFNSPTAISPPLTNDPVIFK